MDDRDEALKELMADPAYVKAGEACMKLFSDGEDKDSDVLKRVASELAKDDNQEN